jgi:hypothetical protein
MMVSVFVHPVVLGLLIRYERLNAEKPRKIEMARQNVKKVAADRRSNFIFRQALYQNEKSFYQNFSRLPYLGV